MYNNDILFTVYDEKNEEFNTLSTPSGTFEILFENDYHRGYTYNKTIPLMSMYAVVGEKTVTAADGREYRESIEKKYLTIPPYDDGDKRTSACIDTNFGSSSFLVPVTPPRTLYNEFVPEEQKKFIENYKQIENVHTDLFIKPDVLASSAKYFENLRTQQINLIVKAIKGEISPAEYTAQFKTVWESAGGTQLEQEAQTLNKEKDTILAGVKK